MVLLPVSKGVLARGPWRKAGIEIGKLSPLDAMIKHLQRARF